MSRSSIADRKGSAVITFPTDTAYRVVRRFGGSPNAVFRALTEPELIKRWWGFASAQWLVCESEARVGGRWRFVTVDRGQEVAFHGRYTEVDRPRRLVQTEIYEGLPGFGPDTEEGGTLNAVDLTEEDGMTTMTVLVECFDPAVRQAIFDSGMESGMQVSYDRIDDLLGELD